MFTQANTHGITMLGSHLQNLQHAFKLQTILMSLIFVTIVEFSKPSVLKPIIVIKKRKDLNLIFLNENFLCLNFFLYLKDSLR